MSDSEKNQLNMMLDGASSETLMKFLIENDIISLSDVQEQIAEMNLENYVRKTHSHEIWKGKDGRWRTYVPDEKTPKKRRMVAKSSKRKLLEYLLDIQESRESEMFPVIRDHEMTKKNFYNVSLIMRQIFQYAYDAEILEKNPFDRVKKDLGKFFRKVRKPADESTTLRYYTFDRENEEKKNEQFEKALSFGT